MKFRGISKFLIRMPKKLDAAFPKDGLILQCKKIPTPMDSKITIPESVCDDEVVDYIASRYSITPRQVITQFMCQEGILSREHTDTIQKITLEENEMAILRDMGIRSSYVEFEKTTI